MPKLPNAFNFRVADQGVLDTPLFLNLYSPVLLTQLELADFRAPKLVIFNGSPGSGKSSLLRLFEINTLIALCREQGRNASNNLIHKLAELGFIADGRPVAFGIYLHCDSSLRDIKNLDVEHANSGLLNTLLDIRIISAYLRSIDIINKAFIFTPSLPDIKFEPLPPDEYGPELFAKEHTFATLKDACRRIERDFAMFLNSFPGDPIPDSLKNAHSRLYSLTYLNRIRSSAPELKEFLPIVMLDDLHELYDVQRTQIVSEFRRRSAIPRWIAVRKHIYEIEDLVNLDGAIEDRDFSQISLDSTSPALFRKFVSNVAERRVGMSSALQPYNIADLEDRLEPLNGSVSLEEVRPDLEGLLREVRSLDPSFYPKNLERQDGEVEIEFLAELESRLIIIERQRRKKQQNLFGESVDESAMENSKVKEAGRLFACERFKIPYYHSFDTLSEAATGNVEQFLRIAAPFADKLISRLELGVDSYISACDQQTLLRKSAQRLFDSIELGFSRGYAIKQLVNNLGTFFRAVTERPNAPYAPGVNGFGFEALQFRKFVDRRHENSEIAAFVELLTIAVAGNIFFVRPTNQGKAGTQRIVFYLNRLLCVKYNLPLTTGGWRSIDSSLLMKMTRQPVGRTEWGKRWESMPVEDFDI